VKFESPNVEVNAVFPLISKAFCTLVRVNKPSTCTRAGLSLINRLTTLLRPTNPLRFVSFAFPVICKLLDTEVKEANPSILSKLGQFRTNTFTALCKIRPLILTSVIATILNVSNEVHIPSLASM